MRRAALMVACVVAVTGVGVALAAGGSPVRPPPGPDAKSLVLTTSQEGTVLLATAPRGMWDYYGKVASSDNGSGGGSYRALCTALEPPPTPGPKPAFTGQVRKAAVTGDRLTCTIVVLFENDNASLVMQGVVTKPSGPELFAAPSDRVLALTGGTGALTYQGAVGVAYLSDARTINIKRW